MERIKTKRRRLIEELSRLAFMEPEEGQGIKIGEKLKALELLGKCLELMEQSPGEAEGKIEVSVRVEDGE